MPDAVLLSYMAGILDGEGSISIYKCKRTRCSNVNPAYGISVRVCMTDKEIPAMFRKYFNGSIQSRKRSIRSKKQYDWSLSASNAKEFLEIMLPYMRIERKIKVAKLAIQIQTEISNHNYRGRKIPKEILNTREKFYMGATILNLRGV